MTSNKALRVALILFLPALLLNLSTVIGIPLLEVMYRHISNPYYTLIIFTVSLLVLIGGFIALVPIFRLQKVFLVNLLLGLFMILVFFMFVHGRGYDMYKCDILKIPNCD